MAAGPIQAPPAPGGSSADEALRRSRPVLRIAVVWLLTAATLMGLSAVLADVQVKDVGAALGASALIGLVNALI